MVDYSIENEYREKGFNIICGVDEAGRGPLAGPVYAAAVILSPDCVIEGLNDSKKLTEKKREALFDEINATFLAMNRAIDSLSVRPDLALIDGNQKPHTDIEEVTVIKGDAKSMSIAAASVLAKVSRDRFMLEMAEKYPQYEFARHKGYGTKLHYEKIAQYGVCDIHRRNFLKKILGEQK